MSTNTGRVPRNAPEPPAFSDLLALLDLERARDAFQRNQASGASTTDLVEMETAAQGARARLSRAAASIYESLTRAGRLPVVAPLIAGCCSVCFIRIPTILAGSIHHGNSLVRCPHCHRVLYLESLMSNPMNSPPASLR